MILSEFIMKYGDVIGWGSIVVGAGLLVFALVADADATTLGSRSVGVVLSNTCLVMIDAGINHTCPTYADVKQLDNSNQAVSGILKDSGREKPMLQNSWRWYDFDEEYIVFVDPPAGYSQRIPNIMLHPNFDTYFLRDSKLTMINDTQYLVQYHDRYVDDKCMMATINADKWKLLVGDTIHYMRNNCDDSFTMFNHVEHIPINKTEHDISSSQDWQHKQFIKDVKEHCIHKYRECTD